MSKRFEQGLIVLVVVFAAAQLIRPERSNPPIDAGRTFRAHAADTNELAGVLDRSCRDCHSNETAWPWYTGIAPVSWLMTYGVQRGRQSVNFSEWATYQPERQRALLDESCRDATAGKMPGAYAWLRPETRLSAEDIETICAAARQADAHARASQ
jgi:hypothetical protein